MLVAACLAGALTHSTAVMAAATARDLSAEAKRLMASGDRRAALTAFGGARKLVEQGGPLDRELIDFMALNLYNLGVGFNNDRQPSEALTSFVEALRLQRLAPNLRDAPFRGALADAALAVGSFLVASRRSEETLEAYRLLELVVGPEPQVELGLGAAQLARGDLSEAKAAYERAASRDPALAEAAAGMGRVSLAEAAKIERSDPIEAIALQEMGVDHLDRAATQDPKSAQRRRELAAGAASLSAMLARGGRAAESLQR
ncbi:MAG TPA: hypothetical protein VFG76_04045, partial [Candidatus Polarisedimenticolia bacterium]|nr:hypothetical protein [Candidatus Polarisedimenticolia bacterium]